MRPQPKSVSIAISQNYLKRTIITSSFLIEKYVKSFMLLSRIMSLPFNSSSKRCKVGVPLCPNLEKILWANVTSFCTAIVEGNFFWNELPASSRSVIWRSWEVRVEFFCGFTRRLSSGMPYTERETCVDQRVVLLCLKR